MESNFASRPDPDRMNDCKTGVESWLLLTLLQSPGPLQSSEHLARIL
jgi:hypothetical protein